VLRGIILVRTGICLLERSDEFVRKLRKKTVVNEALGLQNGFEENPFVEPAVRDLPK
jgi:hypothetical protein